MNTPIKSICLKCIDCCCGSPKEVKLCTVVGCALHPYRFGRRPGVKREATREERERLKKAREARLKGSPSDSSL